MVIAATLIALSLADKDWTWLRPIRWKMGLAIVGVLVLPWGIAILVTTSGVYYQESIGQDLIGKVVSAQESHGAPPGYYLLLVSLTFFPGSLFLFPALRNAWRERLTPQFRYLLAWAIPSWVLFELFPTKLPHYTMPTYPALALMVAAAVMAAVRGHSELLTGWLGRANLALWSVLGILLAVFITLAPIHWGEGLRPFGLALSFVGVGLVLIAGRYALDNRFLHAMRTGIAAAFVLFGSLLELTLPYLERIAVSPRLTATLETHFGEDHTKWPHIASTGYAEPSLVFLTATRTKLVKAEAAAAHLQEVPDGVALVESRNEDAFQAQILEMGLTLEPFDKVDGHNYSNGRDVTVTFYRRMGS
jgi:4-amino-4-deoxy-L-arabinose transferase-like glycosyltransferase